MIVDVLGTRRAFSLVEMIVVIAMLAILMTLGVATITGLMRVEQAAEAAARRLAQRAELATQFRADVAGADATPAKAEGENAGPTCLLLHRPDGGHVVYRWLDGRLRRREPGSKEGPVVLEADKAVLEFVRTDGPVPRLTLRLRERLRREVKERVTEITAVLGGDLR